MTPPFEPPASVGRPRWSQIADRVTGAERERRLLVRIAELEQRLGRLEARESAGRGVLERVDARVHALDRQLDHLRWAAAPGLDPVNVPRNGRLVLSGESPSSMVICSSASGPDADLLSVTGTTHAAYGWRWGWDVVLDSRRLSAAGEPDLGRLRLVRQLLDEHAWVLWLDATVSFVDTSADLLAQAEPHIDLYVSRGPAGCPVPARPVMLLRSGEWARQLIDQLIEEPDATIAPERYAVLGDAWAWEPGRPVDGGPYLMLNPGREAATRHAIAVERLATLRSTAAGIPGPFDTAGALTAFPPASATDIPDLLAALGLRGTAVVAGSAPPAFDEDWRAAWKGTRIIRVTPTPLAGESAGVDRWTCDEDEAAARLEEPVDVVWLLGATTELVATQRLMTWWPLVRPGGVMIGHPFSDLPAAGASRASGPAVRWFFEQQGLPVWLAHDDSGAATWLVHRPRASGSDASMPDPPPAREDESD